MARRKKHTDEQVVSGLAEWYGVEPQLCVGPWSVIESNGYPMSVPSMTRLCTVWIAMHEQCSREDELVNPAIESAAEARSAPCIVAG